MERDTIGAHDLHEAALILRRHEGMSAAHTGSLAFWCPFAEIKQTV
jgi:hypothetical protein